MVYFLRMSGRLQKILLITAFILFTVGAGFAIYTVFFKTKTISQPTPEEQQAGTGTLPEAGSAQGGNVQAGGNGGTLPTSGTTNTGGQAIETEQQASNTVLLKDSITKAVSPSSDSAGARYYDTETGQFYRVTTDGVSTLMSDQAFPDVETVSWGNTSDKAILEFPDGKNVLYDFTTKKQTTLPAHWEAFEFSSDDYHIVAKSNGSSADLRFLIIAEPNGSNVRAVETLGANASKTHPSFSSSNQVVAYAEVGQASGVDSQSIILVGQNQENFMSLEVQGRGFEPLWSPSGNTVLYSVWTISNDYKPELWVSGGSPGNINEARKKLNIQTWAHKCAWLGESTVFCAVPDSMPAGIGLQPAAFENIPDHIVKIDLTQGIVTNIGKPEGNLTVRDPVVTADGRNFIFTDMNTGSLYTFRIP